MIRIVGFIRLSLDLRELGAYRWEMYLSWLYVLGIAGRVIFHVTTLLLNL